MQGNHRLNLSDMKNPKKDITELVEYILGTKVTVKEITNTFEEESRKYFVKAIGNIEKHLKKSDQLAIKFGVNLDGLNELIYSAIDNLISFTFAAPVDEMIAHYIYEKDEDGYVTYMLEEGEVTVRTPDELYNLIAHISTQPAS